MPGTGTRWVANRGGLPLAALLALAPGCDLGRDRLRCTLDPAAIQVDGMVSPVCAAIVGLGGVAFDYGVCGAPCPPPWTVRVTWRNLTTGEAGEVVGTYQVSSCWPFSATSCQGAFWGVVDVPLAPGLNQVELEADEGDGFTACRTVEVVRMEGC